MKAETHKTKTIEQAGDYMNNNVSENNQTNDSLEKELLLLKQEYQTKQMSDEQFNELQKQMENAHMDNKKERTRQNLVKFSISVAAVLAFFIALPNTSASIAQAMEDIPVIGQLVKVVTFRNYQYEGERNMADIDTPKLVLEDETTDSSVQDNLEKTTDNINSEIERITDDLVKSFKENLEEEQGYQDIIVKSEVITSTKDYFTLKLICYQGAGSGYQWNYYYTIDLNTGERLQLIDIFKEGADFITPISDNIKKQMEEQMAADENVYYWLNDEMEEFNFKSITNETSFYLDKNNDVIISFDEGDVAPMYMGPVEFKIPADILKDIRK